MWKLISIGLAAALFLSSPTSDAIAQGISGDLKEIPAESQNGCGRYFSFIRPDGPATYGILIFAFKERVRGSVTTNIIPVISTKNVIVVIDDTKTVPWAAWRPGHAEIRISAKHRREAPCLVHAWPV